jgi:O-antigen biosynthesis protein
MTAIHDRNTATDDEDTVWSPSKVVVVDVDSSDRIHINSDVEPRYTKVLALVRRCDRPIALVSVPVTAHTSVVDAIGQLITQGGALSIKATSPGPVTSSPLPSATVVIPSAFARLSGLRMCVESLLELDYPEFDVIVVDNREIADAGDHAALTDGLRREITIVHEPRRGGSAARNRGLAASTGEIVAFTDDDVVVSRGWLRHLGRAFAASTSVGAVTGSVIPRELETEAQEMFENFYGGFNRGFRSTTYGMNNPRLGDRLFPYAPGKFGTGANMAFRKETLVALGGFDEALGPGTIAKGGEELRVFITLIRSGFQLAVEPAAYVFHTHRRTHRELDAQVRDYGIGLAAMYTSLMMGDRHHVAAMLHRLPRALVQLSRSNNGTVTRTDDAPAIPKHLQVLQLAGFAIGPVAYLASRVQLAMNARRFRGEALLVDQ